MCVSLGPLPPIQMLSMGSTEIPWLEPGQMYSSEGPPQEFTRLPSGSNSSTGGAARQHSPIGGSASAPPSVRSVRLPRWTMNTWSRESTPTPTADPSTMWSGSGLGQNGSTTKIGASAALADAVLRRSWAT